MSSPHPEVTAGFLRGSEQHLGSLRSRNPATQVPHANVFPAGDIALAALSARLRWLEARKELQPCSRLPPTPLIRAAKAQPLTPCRWGGKASLQARAAPAGAGWVFACPTLQSLPL